MKNHETMYKDEHNSDDLVHDRVIGSKNGIHAQVDRKNQTILCRNHVIR